MMVGFLLPESSGLANFVLHNDYTNRFSGRVISTGSSYDVAYKFFAGFFLVYNRLI